MSKIKMAKEEVIKLLVERMNETNEKDKKSFSKLEDITGYSKRQLIRLSNNLNEKPPDEIIEHKNKGRVPSNAAKESEIEFMIKLKVDYPEITIAQFKDIVDEDYITSPAMEDIVKQHELKKRSYSWYENLFRKQGWRSPVKHKRYSSDYGRIHSIRQPRPKRGELIQLDGTPHDWFNNGHKYCLHLAVDDATSEVLAGFFTDNECLYGYCKLMVLVLDKYGIPAATYSDRHQIFKSQDDHLTNFGWAMNDLGVDMIFAASPQAKGRIERMNLTEQNRLVNDLKRFKIKEDLDELNKWFNEFYTGYLNKKFSYPPLDPEDAFVEIIDKQYDYRTLFTLRIERTMLDNSIFSLDGILYSPTNEENGEIIYIRKGVKVQVRHEILTNEIVIFRYEKRIPCIKVGTNPKARRKNVMNDVKSIDNYFDNKERKK